MIICIAQTKSVKDNISHNINHHLQFIEIAVKRNADFIFFPELSLTGYEPTLANKLATTKDDFRFDEFQQMSNEKQIIIGVGFPLKNNSGICISMVIFQPSDQRSVYSKQYLHPDEQPFFKAGQNSKQFMSKTPKIAMAICYEINVPEHAENAFRLGAEIYIASVAKSVKGVKKAEKRLSTIAKKYSMTVFMVNGIGPSDDFIGGGKSAIWNKDGRLLNQLNEHQEGILIFNTNTQKVVKKLYLP